MGSALPKAVMATVKELKGSKQFEVGMAEVNGWRNSMEDAHLVLLREEFGIFGVFDGHGGEACSAFAAKRLLEEFEKHGCPKDDETVKKLFFKVDQEFLDAEQPSGSTATMCVVTKPKSGGKHKLQVINAGDSRVLLGRRDGTIVDGGGTDKGLTRDHKPEDPEEKKRIERCGGRVEIAQGGVARVNGNLSVCRGFGDKDEKKTGGPGPEDRPVTVDPEFTHFDADDTDFLLLVCDGVSEGNFPNPEVVKLAAEVLAKDGDPVAAANAVVHRAVEMDSKDNVTCMMVLLKGASEECHKVELTPGPITKLGHKGFREAYTAMCDRAGVSLAEAAAKRYDMLQDLLKASPDDAELQEEVTMIGTPSGSNDKERSAWFQKWLTSLPEEKESGPGGMDMDSIQQMMGKGGGGKGSAGKGGGKGGPSEGKGAPSESKGAPPKQEEDDNECDGDGFTWSQKGEEVQIVFKLPKPATKKDVKVNFKHASMSVAVSGSSLMDGTLGGKIDTDDCTWCLAQGGKELQVMLTKKDASDKWANVMK